MKTFTGEYAVLKDILKFWKLHVGYDLAERDSKNFRIESQSECQEHENEIEKTDTNQKILEEETSESNVIGQGIQHKKQNPAEEIESEMKKNMKKQN